ncbi:hypothetical protein E4631_21390 [Hymenobacter sp. UV11]|uniref:hypothetical protein n=1 Tax=Hymenobacter sp. UV11 TaxID=1849735 RepID=UPI00105F864C|nr:hypothetical protein [Hymenobacter sp. UV11]TFZ63840.1 hypothetical protein E4631_21390 [Hymenobacter sp. UV11]
MPPSLSSVTLAAPAAEATRRTGWLLPAGLLFLLLLVGRWVQHPVAAAPSRDRVLSSLPRAVPLPIAIRAL